MEMLVVTRHANLLEYLKEKGIVPGNVESTPYAKVEDVEGKHVVGVLPLWLACHTKKFTEIQVRVPQAKHNTELTIEDIRYCALEPKTYIIREEN